MVIASERLREREREGERGRFLFGRCFITTPDMRQIPSPLFSAP